MDTLERALVDLVARIPGEILLETDLHFETGERSAETHVDTVPEREVMCRPAAVDVVYVGTLPDPLVAVPGAAQEQHLVAGGPRSAVALDIAGGGARRCLWAALRG